MSIDLDDDLVDDIDDLDDMEPVIDTTYIDILNNLLSKDDIETKTHIFKPKKIAVLNIVADLLKSFNLPKSSAIIERFIELYLIYMVSYNRESRKEIKDILIGLVVDDKESKKSISDNLN